MSLVFLSVLLLTGGLLLRGIREGQEGQEGREEKESLAVISGFIIDENAVLRRKEKEENLPEIKVELPPIYGEEKVAGETMRVTLGLIKELKGSSLTVKLVEIYNQELMNLWLEDNIKVVYNISLDPKEGAAALQIMLSSFKIEGKKVAEIDLRFGKPVVRF